MEKREKKKVVEKFPLFSAYLILIDYDFLEINLVSVMFLFGQ